LDKLQNVKGSEKYQD